MGAGTQVLVELSAVVLEFSRRGARAFRAEHGYKARASESMRRGLNSNSTLLLAVFRAFSCQQTDLQPSKAAIALQRYELRNKSCTKFSR